MPRRVARRRGLTCALATVLALAATVVLVPPAQAMYAAVVTGSSPIAYYRLGESGGSTMTDSSGHGHDGTYVGGFSLGGAPAITVDTDTSASFDGTGWGYESGVAAPQTGYTIEAWVRPSDGSDEMIAGQIGGGQLFIGGGQLTLSQTGDLVSGGPTLSPGTWWHVAATWDGTTTRLYVNGTEVASSVAALTAPSGSGDINVGFGDQAPPFRGSLDEVGYYGSALSAATIADHVVVGTDATAPDITITTPADNGIYVLHATPSPVHSCADPGGSGIQSCTATPFGTYLGPSQFTVTGTDRAGNTASRTVAYVVVPNRYADEVMLSSPIAFYRLDDPVGATVLTDSSGHGNNGSYKNGVAPGSHHPAAIACERRPDPPRVCDLAADPEDFSTYFGGLGYGYVNDLAAPTTAYTLEAWVKPDDTGAGSIVGQGGAGQLYLTGGHLALRQTQDDVVSSSPTLTPGTWWHVAATWNGTTTRLYVNGNLVATSSTARKAPSGAATVYVGQGEQAPTFRGDLDEVAYYATALPGGVLKEHYDVGTAIDWPSIPPVPPGTNTGKPSGIITSPAVDALYAPTKTPPAHFACTDPDGPADLTGCTATVDGTTISDGATLPDSLGPHVFEITATDQGGNTDVHAVTYTVETFAEIYRADSPIAYYRLGDTDQVMADASGHGRDGEYKNRQESGPVGISGDLDRARRFWGDSGYGFSNGVGAGPFQSTIEAWVNPDSASRDQAIAGLAGTDELYVVGGRFVYRHLDRTVTADVGPDPGHFRQVVGVWDGATIKIYVDGVLHGTAEAATGRSSATGGTFYVGFGTRGTWFLGDLDEVAYYGSALTPERVLQHFLADPPPPLGPAADASGTGCLVPELGGLRLRVAKTELEWANCRLGRISTRRAASWKRGYVLDQAVPANSVRRAGFRVGVTIGR